MFSHSGYIGQGFVPGYIPPRISIRKIFWFERFDI